MQKKTIRTIAILTCFSILTLSIPGSISAEKKPNKFRFLDKPALIIFSIIPIFSPIDYTGNKITLPETNNTIPQKIKITDPEEKKKPPDDDG